MVSYSLGMLNIERTNPVLHVRTSTRNWQYLALALTVFLLAGEFSGQTTGNRSVPQTQEKALDGSAVSFPNNGVAYYEMADFQGVPSIIMWMISHGLHRKIPKDEQAYFVPFFHHEDEWKKLTAYSVPEDAYLIVATADGRVLWQTHGPQTDARYTELRRAIQNAPAN